MRVLCIGDSLTEGDYGIRNTRCVPNVHKMNYPYFLSLTTGCETTNFGYCGYTSSLLLDVYKKENMSSKGYDIAIIILGTNGGLGNDEQGNKDYDELVKLVLKQNPSIKLYICTCPHVTENSSFSNCGYIDRTKPANEFIRTYVKENNYNLIDLDQCPYFTEQTEFVMQPHDGLHFCEIGYYALAKFIRDNIPELKI